MPTWWLKFSCFKFKFLSRNRQEFEMEFGAVQKDLDENKFYVKVKYFYAAPAV